jgi:5'-3' exonuclease
MKLNFDSHEDGSAQKVVKSYLEGLFWILTYYHYGCGSWSWYYPHLYAPLTSDFRNLASFSPISFSRGKPFPPLLQLLSVLPPQSSHLLPSSYARYMIDKNSPLSKFYPSDFHIDSNGKRNVWENIVQIPFIEEKLLLQTINQLNHSVHLNNVERMRNIVGTVYKYRSSRSSLSTTGSVASTSYSAASARASSTSSTSISTFSAASSRGFSSTQHRSDKHGSNSRKPQQTRGLGHKSSPHYRSTS